MLIPKWVQKLIIFLILNILKEAIHVLRYITLTIFLEMQFYVMHKILNYSDKKAANGGVTKEDNKKSNEAKPVANGTVKNAKEKDNKSKVRRLIAVSNNICFIC